MPDIVKEAGVSIGSFYARLASKDALLPLLYRRYHREVGQRGMSLDRTDRSGRISLAVACHLVVEPFVWLYTARTNLMRAVTLLARSNPGAIEDPAPERMDLHRKIEQSMLRFGPDIRRKPGRPGIAPRLVHGREHPPGRASSSPTRPSCEATAADPTRAAR